MKIWLLVTLAACNHALDQRLAILDEPRVLAVTADPAEAKPGAMVAYAALIGGPDGPITDAPAWSYCTASKPPTEDNAVSSLCLGDTALVALGDTATVTATMPADACIQFGPDVPSGGFRPRDADPTGGYYQPVRADVDALTAFGLSRITCDLPNVAGDIAHEYQLDYVANVNPTILPLAPGDVAADSDVQLTAGWPAEAVESFLYFDPLAQQLVMRRESMRLSWFATGGSMLVDASAVGEDDPATTVTTTWHTPAAGPATLWLVLRDSRGGIATQIVSVTVR